MLLFEVRKPCFLERIENPVNIKNIVDYYILKEALKDFLSKKPEGYMTDLYYNNIYMGLKSIEIAMKEAIFKDVYTVNVQIYEQHLKGLICAIEMESVKDSTYYYIIKEMFDLYECGPYKEIEIEDILKPEYSLEIKNGKVIKNDFYYLNRVNLTIRFNNNKTGNYYALYRAFSLLSDDDRNSRWHDFYRDLFAIVKYELKWSYSDFNLTAYEHTKTNDSILYDDVKIEYIEDDEYEYSIFL